MKNLDTESAEQLYMMWRQIERLVMADFWDAIDAGSAIGAHSATEQLLASRAVRRRFEDFLAPRRVQP